MSKPTVWRWQERYLDEGVRSQARQDTTLARAAVASGNKAESDCQDCTGNPAQRHALEPHADGRGHGHFALERWSDMG